MGHLLPRLQGIQDALDAVCHIVPEAVILPGVDSYHKGPVLFGNLRDLFDDRFNVADVIDLLSQDITSRHIGVHGHGPEHLQVLHQIIGRCNIVLHDGQRNPADAGEKPDHHPRLLHHRRHHLMHLPEHLRSPVLLDQGRIGDLHIADALRCVAPGGPEELVLEYGIIPVHGTLVILLHLQKRPRDIRVRYPFCALQRNLLLGRLSLGKDIAVQIHLLQIREYGLSVLHDRKGGADPRNIVFRIFQIPENQLREVDKCIVIDFPVQVLAGKRRILIPLCRLFSQPGELFRLLFGRNQSQLPDIVERIPDLMINSQRNQQIRGQIGIHMGVQIRPELALPENVCLDDGFGDVQLIILRLAHQRL